MTTNVRSGLADLRKELESPKPDLARCKKLLVQLKVCDSPPGALCPLRLSERQLLWFLCSVLRQHEAACDHLLTAVEQALWMDAVLYFLAAAYDVFLCTFARPFCIDCADAAGWVAAWCVADRGRCQVRACSPGSCFSALL